MAAVTARVEWVDRGAVRMLLYGGTILAVLAGVWFRLQGVGTAPFAIDEYYIATSVKSITEHGLPLFHGGGLYDRGLLLQYLVAPLFLAGVPHELAFRLVTVAANLAALPAVFLLARALGGSVAGCLAVVLFSLSLWEVEFARFARMYAPFATLFLWQTYCLVRYLTTGEGRMLAWAYGLALVSVFVAEFAIFMVLMTFLPLLLRPARRVLVEYTIPTALLALAYVYTVTDFRRLGAGEYLPEALAVTGAASRGGPVRLPALMPPVLWEHPLWLGLGVAVALLCAAVGVAWVRAALRAPGTVRARLPYLLPVAALLLAVVHQHGLALLLGVTGLLLLGPAWPVLLRGARTRLGLSTMAALALSTGYWFAHAVWLQPGEGLLRNPTGHAVKDAILLLFEYPGVYQEVVLQWLRAMPVQTLLMAAIIAAGVAHAGLRASTEQVRYLLLAGVVAGLCILVAVLETPYSTTRYTYFLYPLVLILVAAAAAWALQGLARVTSVRAGLAAGLAVAFLWLSEDFSARHLWEIDSERVTYRMDYSQGRTDQYYTRFDFRGPAAFVNAGLEPGDTVVTTEYGVPYYLAQLDYLYMDVNGGRFEGISGQGGTRDIWEGARLLPTAEALFRTLGDAPGTVWLVAKNERVRSATPGELLAAEQLADYRVYRSVDGHLDVYRLPPGLRL